MIIIIILYTIYSYSRKLWNTIYCVNIIKSNQSIEKNGTKNNNELIFHASKGLHTPIDSYEKYSSVKSNFIKYTRYSIW